MIKWNPIHDLGTVPKRGLVKYTCLWRCGQPSSRQKGHLTLLRISSRISILSSEFKPNTFILWDIKVESWYQLSNYVREFLGHEVWIVAKILWSPLKKKNESKTSCSSVRWCLKQFHILEFFPLQQYHFLPTLLFFVF